VRTIVFFVLGCWILGVEAAKPVSIVNEQPKNIDGVQGVDEKKEFLDTGTIVDNVILGSGVDRDNEEKAEENSGNIIRKPTRIIPLEVDELRINPDDHQSNLQIRQTLGTRSFNVYGARHSLGSKISVGTIIYTGNVETGNVITIKKSQDM